MVGRCRRHRRRKVKHASAARRRLGWPLPPLAVGRGRGGVGGRPQTLGQQRLEVLGRRRRARLDEGASAGGSERMRRGTRHRTLTLGWGWDGELLRVGRELQGERGREAQEGLRLDPTARLD